METASLVFNSVHHLGGLSVECFKVTAVSVNLILNSCVVQRVTLLVDLVPILVLVAIILVINVLFEFLVNRAKGLVSCKS
jgi:hypothetical protein